MHDLNFLVIGAQKCATSWLYYCLREHPELQLPSRKVEANYHGGPRHRAEGDAWFDSLFAPKATARLRGSVSVDYVHDAQALEATLDRYPAVRMVLCVRDPLARTASAYGFLMRRGLLPDRDLSSLVNQALDDVAQDQATSIGELVSRSLYGHQLDVLAEAGALSRLMVVSHERLSAAPQNTLQQIYRFLGVDDGFVPASLDRQPKRNSNLPLLTRLERLAPRSWLLAKLMDFSNRQLSRTPLARPHPEYRADVAERYRAFLRTDMARFAGHLKRIPTAQKLGDKELENLWGLVNPSARA